MSGAKQPIQSTQGAIQSSPIYPNTREHRRRLVGGWSSRCLAGSCSFPCAADAHPRLRLLPRLITALGPRFAPLRRRSGCALLVRPAAPPRRAQARHLAKVLAWSVRLGSRAAVRSHCLQRSRPPGGARVEPARGARSRVHPGSRVAIRCHRLRSSRPLGAARVEPDRRSSVPGSETNTLRSLHPRRRP
jgi:hypothetical protein